MTPHPVDVLSGFSAHQQDYSLTLSHSGYQTSTADNMNPTHADINRWLITSENPSRQTKGLDYERCAALHNYIVQQGWSNSGLPPSEMPRRTWFDTHSASAYKQRDNLHDTVIEFLKRAWDVAEDMSSFYWVSGLSSPEQLWEDHDPDLADEGEELRFFTLYPMNVGFGGHPDGLNYDQHTFKAIVQCDIADDDRTRRENDAPPWQPLETILSAWIDMIQMGKVQAMCKATKADNEIYHPWISVRFSDGQLQDTIDAFNDLVKAIESRMKVPTDVEEHHSPLIEEHVLNNANVPRGCFARAFLSTAPRPNFTYIAPGISLPDPQAFASNNVFPTTTNNFYSKTIPPIRILNAKVYENVADTTPPFDLPYDNLNPVPCGLYIPPSDLTSSTIAEASARVILPFTLGNSKYARKSDTTRFQNAVDMYQPGFSAFSGDWSTCVRLVRVFEDWRQNVESGEWAAGTDGVVDGTEKFWDADTEGGWEKYCLAPAW